MGKMRMLKALLIGAMTLAAATLATAQMPRPPKPCGLRRAAARR